MKGIYTTMDIIIDNRLTLTDRIVLSVYKYYTENGKYKRCFLTTNQISVLLNISLSAVKKSRKRLKEFGLIESDDIMTIYLGYNKNIGELTNFDLLLMELPEKERTDEMKEYVKSIESEWVSKINKSDIDDINKPMFYSNYRHILGTKFIK